MATPFNFSDDANLPPALAARMQRVADDRAAAGLISDDGQTHPNAECKRVYEAGHGVLSSAYAKATKA